MMQVLGRAKALMAVMASAAVLAFSAPVMAQEVSPEQLALARQYVDLTDNASVFEVTMVETGIETMRQLVTQNPEIMDAVDGAVAKVLEDYRARKDELMNQFARVYALRFTVEELQQIVAFYESEVGKKLSASNLEVNSDLQRVLQVFTENVKREFFAQVRAELRAQGVEV
ncbi:DUF2059 domain-containing protein [Devosia albogilva]|uniref:DUF2059 domain-containing protein n=1 Tax=Devosia albogilva TaxID=429726 RepID=A0ABW5QMY8_9HYPH